MKLKMPKLERPALKGTGGGSSLKVPAVVKDLYEDLRDRRLLPLVALIVVAIAAVPFLLGDGEEAPVPPPLSAGPGAGGPSAEASSLTVVEAKPGLRDYRKRLRDRTPKNPFKQQYTGVPAGAQLESTVSTSDEGSGGGFEQTTEIEVVPTPGSGGPPDPRDPGTNLYAFRPDIRFGVAGEGSLNAYDELQIGRVFPEKAPVIAFMGVSEDGKRASFVVSREVAMVRGEGRCIGGYQNCSLISLRAGQAADLLTGAPNRDFRLKVVRIDFVEIHPDEPVKGTRSTGASGSGLAAGLGTSQNFSK